MEFQNKTSWELEGGGYDSNEFWIPKRHQKKPQNTNSLGLQKSGLNNHRFLDFIKNTKRSRNETVDRELEGKAWRDLGANVLYSIYCTVQYTDGAIKRNRIGFSAVVIEVGTGNHDSKARFADTDIEGSLMIYVLKIHGNNCMGTHHFTLDQKCSVSERQIITQEDEADFPTVVIKANIDDSEIEVKLVDIDIKENMIVDELRTEVYKIDCMGPHLTPTCTGYYSNISNGSQEVAIAEGHSFHVGAQRRQRGGHRRRQNSLCAAVAREERYGTIPVSGQSNHLLLGVFCRPGNRGRECSQVWPELGQ